MFKNLSLKLGCRPMKDSGPPPWSPKDVAGLWGWYRMNTDATLSGSNVTTIADASGNGHPLDKNAGGNATFNVAAKNGLGTVTFNGVSFTTNTFANANHPLTVYFVAKINAWVNMSAMFGNTNNTTTYLLQQTGTAGQGRLFATAGSTTFTMPAVGSWAVLTCIYNGAASKFQIGDAAEVTRDPGAAVLNGFCIGMWNNNFANMDVAEAIVRTTLDDASTRTLHKNYLSNKWGIPL